MKIGEMFQKDIDRSINGVIKVGQHDKTNIYQELNEYVVTNELKKHFNEFFTNYNKGLFDFTNEIGVWISGFFGSGKSHFLKILSYLLDSNLEIDGRKPIDFFKDGKIEDSILLAEMEKASNINADVILFNIDSKAPIDSKNNDKILSVFVKVFNEKRGYCPEYPFLAEFEKQLDAKNKFDEFKNVFKKINGDSWEDSRDDFYFICDDVIESLNKINFMSVESAKNWVEKAESNYSISIQKFAEEVEEYCKSKGDNYHVLFLVDEVGQYIGDDVNLMLNLQSLTEDLGIYSKGKAWLIVTSQQNIDDIVNVKGNDFSKIQGRFKTRLSLSSAHVDEVIRKRILKKNDVAENILKEDFDKNKEILNNIFTFKDASEMKMYNNSQDYITNYPFIPYQFNLLQKVLTSIRTHSASGKHIAEGERSMLALFQESAIANMDNDNNSLISFNNFYNPLDKFIDHTHRSVIIKASSNENLAGSFDVEVLKVLFMIKYVEDLPSTVENLTSLMIDRIDVDRVELKEKVSDSLDRLVSETLVLKNGEIYSFLTDEEQDINREIKNEIVDTGEILNKAAEYIFYDIFKPKKVNVGRYNFGFNKVIDDINIGIGKNEIGLRFISPYYDFPNNSVDGTLTSFSEESREINFLKNLSKNNNEVIIYLNHQDNVFREIAESLQIEKYLQKHSDIKAQLKATKGEELSQKKERIVVELEKALKESDIYIDGNRSNNDEKNAQGRIEDALIKLVNKVYTYLNYMEFGPNKADIQATLNENVQQTFGYDSKCLNAVNAIYNYIENQNDRGMKPSLKNVLERFSKAPYGYTDLDIEWIIAKLISQKRISLSKNSEIISIKNDGVNKIFEYLTKNEFREKILIEKKTDTPIKKINTVKNILKIVFSQSVSNDNDEEIMEIFLSKINSKKADISNFMNYYMNEPKFPGKEVLNNANELFANTLSKKSINQFYNFVYKSEEEFLDLIDELDPVLQFFDSAQKDIFKQALNAHEIYNKNRNFINDNEISEIDNKINDILSNKVPYSRIHELPDLTKSLLNKNKAFIENEKSNKKDFIEKEFYSIVGYLEKNNCKDKFYDDFEMKFENLIQKLNLTNEVSVIRSIDDEAINLADKCKNQINEYLKSLKINNDFDDEVSPVIKSKTVKINSLINNKIIKNDSNIDEILNELKSKLKEELDGYDEIQLRF